MATALVLTLNFSPIKTCPEQRGTVAGWLIFPLFSCEDPLSSHLCHLLFLIPVISKDRMLHLIILLFSHFLTSPTRLSFVLRLRLHAVPPEHQILACWCQSRSPSWHGTCIDWHRTPVLLWPVPKPPGTLETLYPNSGPLQLLKKGEIEYLVKWFVIKYLLHF